MIVLYLMQRLQGALPFNPQALGAVTPDLAFNTAASFTTNTNWQSYVPETTMSYLTQMAGLAYHNFASAAAGIALAVAFVVTVPVNRAMIARGLGHAKAHAVHSGDTAHSGHAEHHEP